MRLQEAREEEKKKKKQQNLFKGLRFFLNRETNVESLTFVIRACKGEVRQQVTCRGWDECVHVVIIIIGGGLIVLLFVYFA